MYSSYKKQQVLHEGWRRYIKEEAAEPISNVHAKIKDYTKNQCTWDYQKSNGMKVFFDISSVGDNFDAGSYIFGPGIIAQSALTKIARGKIRGALGAANHVGIIFKDGTIFHATSDKTGVSFQQNYTEINEKPHQFVVLDLGGDEAMLRQACEEIYELIKSNIDPSQAYDWKGIVRQIPLLGPLLKHLYVAKEKGVGKYKFYCSELVANALVKAGFMTAVELKDRLLKENEEDELDEADEISPTDLYDLISPKAQLVKPSCKITQAEAEPQQSPQSQAEPAKAQTRAVKPERFFESKK